MTCLWSPSLITYLTTHTSLNTNHQVSDCAASHIPQHTKHHALPALYLPSLVPHTKSLPYDTQYTTYTICYIAYTQPKTASTTILTLTYSTWHLTAQHSIWCRPWHNPPHTPWTLIFNYPISTNLYQISADLCRLSTTPYQRPHISCLIRFNVFIPH